MNKIEALSSHKTIMKLNTKIIQSIQELGLDVGGSLYAFVPEERFSVSKTLAELKCWLHFDFFSAIEQGISLTRLDEVIAHNDGHLDVHLLTVDAMNNFAEICKRNVHRITFPFEGLSNPQRIAMQIRSAGHSPWLALAPETPVSLCLSVLPYVDGVLVMLIPPGSKDHANLSLLCKVHELKERSIKAGVDGGVNESNFLEAIEAGACYFVLGRSLAL